MANGQYGKGTVKLAYPFENLSRKLDLRKNTCKPTKANPNSTTFAIVSVKKGATKFATMVQRQIFSIRKNWRTSALTADERDNRARFAEVSAWVKNAKGDLVHLSQYQADFLAQRDNPNGIKSFFAYLWYLGCEDYDSKH